MTLAPRNIPARGAGRVGAVGISSRLPLAKGWLTTSPPAVLVDLAHLTGGSDVRCSFAACFWQCAPSGDAFSTSQLSIFLLTRGRRRSQPASLHGAPSRYPPNAQLPLRSCAPSPASPARDTLAHASLRLVQHGRDNFAVETCVGDQDLVVTEQSGPHAFEELIAFSHQEVFLMRKGDEYIEKAQATPRSTTAKQAAPNPVVLRRRWQCGGGCAVVRSRAAISI